MRFQRDRGSSKGSPDVGAADPDTATLRSLARISGGDPSRFATHSQPPEEIQTWIGQLDLAETNGLLIHALRRWHALGGDR